MFSTSTQANSWVFNSVEEVSKRREEANRKFIAANTNGMNVQSASKYFLNSNEEKILRNHYELILRKFCKSFQPPMTKSVIGCAFHYYKRFYLNNSVMDFHPKDLVVTCVYLSCKVEEFNVTISQFVANVKGDREKATEIILNLELLLMQQLNFDLSIYTPYRPVEGFLIDIKTRYSQISNPEAFRSGIDEFLDVIQFSDAYFLYSSSQIALAAVAYGAEQCQESLDGYITDILFDHAPDKAVYMKEAIDSMISMVKNLERPAHDKYRITLEKRLEKCRKEENNPNSAAYKRKLEEMLDDDEEPIRKYSKLTEDEARRIKEDEECFGIKMLNT